MPSGSYDINVRLLALMGIVSTILVVALVVTAQAWFRYEFQQENVRKYEDVPNRQLQELTQTQLADLHAPAHVVEAEGGRRVIPIDQAMVLVVKKYGQAN